MLIVFTTLVITAALASALRPRVKAVRVKARRQNGFGHYAGR